MGNYALLVALDEVFFGILWEGAVQVPRAPPAGWWVYAERPLRGSRPSGAASEVNVYSE